MMVYPQESYRIVGAAFEVYNKLGILLNFGCSDGLEKDRIVL